MLAFAWLATVSVSAQDPQPLLVESADQEEFTEEMEEEDEIETDRDSFTPATTTVGWRRLVLESAYSFIDNRQAPDTHSFPELIARFGIDDHLELRLGWNYEVGGEGNAVSGGSGISVPFEDAEIESESQISYGIKSMLSQQRGWMPQSALILQAGTPTSGPDPATQFITTYAFGWQTADGWKSDSSIRYGFDSEHGDHFNTWAPSTVLKKSIGKNGNAHVEYFGLFSDGKERESVKHFFSPGLHYLVTSDFEVGVRVGWGLNDQSANFFTNVGVGLRY